MRHGLLLIAFGLAGCCCQEIRAPDPVTELDIIRWTREGVAPETIIQRIRDSRTVYIMDAKDVLDLHEKGVDNKVIDYMLQTQREDAERRAWHYRSHYYDPYWGPPYPPYYFGWGWHHCW
jgi:hypothetical protein